MSMFELRTVGDDLNVVRSESVRLKSWDGHNVAFNVGADGLFAVTTEDGILLGREEARSSLPRPFCSLRFDL